MAAMNIIMLACLSRVVFSATSMIHYKFLFLFYTFMHLRFCACHFKDNLEMKLQKPYVDIWDPYAHGHFMFSLIQMFRF